MVLVKSNATTRNKRHANLALERCILFCFWQGSDAESVSGRSSTLEDIIDKSSQSSVWHALSTFVTRNLG
ncbi:Accumulates dyads protein [Trichinella spiralis]|uniref:Accumulates dyads protein n=1 Tax=Trichinella spiralis TaxID=6334 RepID=A0ABR3L3Y0_TRISP